MLRLLLVLTAVTAVRAFASATPIVDRFSDQAGHLFRRSANPALPAPGAPIDFDQAPFITQGLGPDGQLVSYYNLDAQPRDPAPIYVFFRQGEDQPVASQHNLVNVIPGDNGYNDFWNVVKVVVPATYIGDSIRNVADLMTAGFAIEKTNILVNCPVVPNGSTAALRFAGNTDTALHQGWYNDQAIYYFNFSETQLRPNSAGKVPVSPILVTFNKNPDMNDATSGPASGFVTEPGSAQTHNVLATLPADAGYSPLWSVSVYDNTAFANVHDLSGADQAPRLADGVATVNCPVVKAGMSPMTTRAFFNATSSTDSSWCQQFGESYRSMLCWYKEECCN